MSKIGQLMVAVVSFVSLILVLAIKMWPGNIDKTDQRLFLEYWWVWVGLLILNAANILYVIANDKKWR